MAMTTIRPGDATRTTTDEPRRGRGPRALGAAVAAAVAAVPAAAGFVLAGTLFLAVGIPAAAIAGALVGPSIRSGSANVGPTAVMATLSVALGDLIVVAWLMLGAGSGGSGSALADMAYIGILGLAAVGIPMLLITMPCAIVWAAAVGRLVAPGPAGRSA